MCATYVFNLHVLFSNQILIVCIVQLLFATHEFYFQTKYCLCVQYNYCLLHMCFISKPNTVCVYSTTTVCCTCVLFPNQILFVCTVQLLFATWPLPMEQMLQLVAAKRRKEVYLGKTKYTLKTRFKHIKQIPRLNMYPNFQNLFIFLTFLKKKRKKKGNVKL